MKKRIVTVVAIVMALLMTVLSPIQTFAAARKVYISEIRMSDAREKLTELGYTVLDKDLNAGGNDGYTYIGYKTTTNPDEAITDISIMDMKGGYSFSDYEEILEQQKKDIKKRLSTYRIAIDEFAERYYAGSKAAVIAFESLNVFIEDDSGRLLGDMLIDSDLSDEDLTKITMQASMIVNSTIADCLAIGLAQYGEGNWLSQISKKEDTAPDAYEDAEILINTIVLLRDSMQSYLDTGLTLNDYEKNPEAFTDFTAEKLQDFGESGILYEALSLYKYKDGTVADLFMAESIKPEDLFPLIAALTPGQLAIAKISGFQTLIRASSISDVTWDDAKANAEESIKEVYEDAGNKKVSVYIGVDREMYNGGVALTNEAMRKSASTGDTSWWHGNISTVAEMGMLMGGFFSVAMIATFYGMFYAFYTATMVIAAPVAPTAVTLTSSLLVDMYFMGVESCFKVSLSSMALYEQSLASYALSQRMMAIGVAGMWISGAILCILAGLYVGLEVYNYYNPEYTDIPLILMDLKFGEDDNIGDWEKYVKYKAVLNEGSSAGDLNGFAGKQWNAMYVTKDRAAGFPIEADSFVVQYGDNTAPRDFQPVHYFGLADAFNLNSHCYNDDVDGIYMFFRDDDKAFASELASVFGSGALAAVTGFVGLAIGALGAVLITKKKKEPTTAA